MQPLTTLSSDYVQLQLRLADKVVELGLCAMDQAVLRYTNLARRFGLEPDEATSNKQWRYYLARLQTLGPISARADLTREVANTFGQVTGRRQYAISCGPFSAEVREGVVRTHFLPSDSDNLSPLHASKLTLRQAELRSVVRQARAMHPEARRIAGASWLYNTASYRSIFPAAHVRTPVVRTGMTSFQGSSSWGQFLDHRGGVKPNLRHEFLTNLGAFDGTQPWRLFPMPTLLVNSPIEVFDD